MAVCMGLSKTFSLVFQFIFTKLSSSVTWNYDTQCSGETSGATPNLEESPSKPHTTKS